MQIQLWCRTTAASGEMRQDKCFELHKAQLRWNGLPALTSSHSGHTENWTISYPVSATENPSLQRLADKFACLEKPATSRTCGAYCCRYCFPLFAGTLASGWISDNA
jgi:hypothetical protein